MTFTNLSYIGTIDFEDEALQEIKFTATYENKDFENDLIEIWKDEESINVLRIDSNDNIAYNLTDKEELFVLKHAIMNNFISR